MLSRLFVVHSCKTSRSRCCCHLLLHHLWPDCVTNKAVRSVTAAPRACTISKYYRAFTISYGNICTRALSKIQQIVLNHFLQNRVCLHYLGSIVIVCSCQRVSLQELRTLNIPFDKLPSLVVSVLAIVPDRDNCSLLRLLVCL